MRLEQAYQILDLPDDASIDEAKKAYRKAALRCAARVRNA